MDFFGIGQLAGSAISAGASLWNNQQNLKFQRENLDYNKALQERMFNREDSSYQRTVADMRKAGISPLAMSGTNGAGEAIATTPMQSDLSGFAQAVSQLPSQLLSMKQQSEAIKGAKLDNQYKSIVNQYASEKLAKENEALGLSNTHASLINTMQQYLNAEKDQQVKFNKYFNINPDMGEKERAAMFALKMAGVKYNDTPKQVLGALKQSTKTLLTDSFDFAKESLAELKDSMTPESFKIIEKALNKSKEKQKEIEDWQEKNRKKNAENRERQKSSGYDNMKSDGYIMRYR